MINENDYFNGNLNEFYGTSNYYKIPPLKIMFENGKEYILETNIMLTDGTNYIANNGLYWFIKKIIYNKKIIANEFVSITLEAKDNRGIITWTDDEEVKHKELIDYTDFFGSITLFLTDNILMLASEY